MIRTMVESTTDPAAVHPKLGDHQAVMIRRCPFLGPSAVRGLTLWSAYEAEPHDQCALLNLLVSYAEVLRQVRKTDGPLVCRNIAVFGPHDADQARALMDWPAWICRNLYAPVQVIVDRFWIGLGRGKGKGQSVMPPPPVSFFMVRCGIPNRDRLIVAEQSPDLLARWKAGPGDDQRDVFIGPLGRTVDDPGAAWTDLVAAFPVPT